MIMFPFGMAEKETIKTIKKVCLNEKVKSIELLRK
jgi:hypothetical protein